MEPRIRNLAAIAAAVRVAEHGSFSAGSAALGLSPSAASKAVARLEDELGIKLFHRTTRSVGLTTEGREFVDGVRPLLEDLDALTAHLIDSAGAPRGLLRISAPETFGRSVVAPLIARYRAQFPEVTVDLSLDDRNVDLAEERIDVAIRTGTLPDHANLVARRLLLDPLVVCAAPAYLERSGVPASPEALSAHACISYQNAHTGAAMPWRFLGNERTAVMSVITVNDVSAVTRLAVAGAGIAQLPRYLALPFLETGRLAEVLGDVRPEGVPYSAVYLDRRFVSPRVRSWVDFLAAEMRSIDAAEV